MAPLNTVAITMQLIPKEKIKKIEINKNLAKKFGSQNH